MGMCTDYRKFNAQTRSDSFPLPRIDDIIDSVGYATFLTKIDMSKGYYQVPLNDNAKVISAFITLTACINILSCRLAFVTPLVLFKD